MVLSESIRVFGSQNVSNRVKTYRAHRALSLGLASIPLLLAGCGTSGSSTAAAPTFTPPAGQYNAAQTVTVGDTTPGAVLHCTTDGTAPTTSSPVCIEPTTVAQSETLSAIAAVPGGDSSSVTSAAYTITLTAAAAPTFTTVAGAYTSAQTVSLADTTPGAEIYYTLDGTTPSASSTLFDPSAPIAIPGSVPTVETISAIAIASGYANSAIVTATYTIAPPAPAPTITPNGGTFIGAQSNVTITDSVTGAPIYYTLDGSTPTQDSTRYSGAIAVNASETVNAVAIAPGYSLSSATTAAFSLMAPPPAFGLAPGNYTGVQNATISDAIQNALIFYTISTGGNSATPVPGASGTSQYTRPIQVASTETITALAVATGFTNSQPATAAYTVTLPQTMTPVIALASGAAAPPTGTYNAAQTVTITDTTSGAAIYYTTDGSTPSATHGTTYGGPVTVSTSETITAVAIAYGYNTSMAATAQFSLIASVPVISVPTGTYTAVQSVSITDANATAKIYYTTDGSTPTTSSTPYTQSFTAGQNFNVGQRETVQAIAQVDGFTDSAVTSSILTFNLPVTAKPTISPDGGTFASNAEPTVTISAIAGATVYYTTDGTAPTIGGKTYSAPFTVTSNETVAAIAVAPGDAPSQTATQVYKINQNSANPPSFSPTGGNFSAAQMVTISDTTPNATIYYAVGSAPSPTPGNVYAPGTVIDIAHTETLYAIATAPGFNQSTTASATYTITQPSAGTLVFSQPSGTVLSASNQTVMISGAASGATIYYTTDGSQPSSGSPQYNPSGGITVTAPETIDAIAIENGYTNSVVASATYEYQVDTPVIDPGGGSFSTASETITITDDTPGATIYYTVSTNGTTPTTGSTPYTGTFTISATDTIEAIAVNTATGYTNSSVASATFSKTVSSGPSVSGTVISGTQPILGARVQLYAAGTTGYGSAPTAVGNSATTDPTSGAFSLSYTCPSAPGDLIYIVATGGHIGTGAANAGIGLMMALGPCAALATSLPTGGITVNEVTTIASVYALSGFASFPSSGGGIDVGAPAPSATCATGSIGRSTCNYPGLLNAFATVNNLVDIGTGTARTITPAYAANPVAYLNTSMVPQARIDTLADILATCVEASTGCSALFSDAGGATSPADTIQAALDIALNPGNNVATLYALLQTTPPYTPTLASIGDTVAPSDWTLAITYTGGGLGVDYSLDPSDNVEGNSMALDGLGNVWVLAGAPNTANGGSMDALPGMIAGFNNLGAPLTPATVFDATTMSVTSFGGFGPAGIGSNTFPGVFPIDAGGYQIGVDASNNLWAIAGSGIGVAGDYISKVAVDLTNTTTPLALVNFPADSQSNGQITLSLDANSFAFDPSGDLWASIMTYNGPIYDFDPANGTLRTQFTSDANNTGLFDLTFDSAGGLWGGDVLDQNTQLYNIASGALAATINNTQGFYQIAGAAGSIYTCDAFTGYDVFSATSTTPVNYNVNAGCGPFVVDGAGNIWSISGANGDLYLTEVSANGNLMTPAAGYSATSSAESPMMLQVNSDPATAVDGSGNLWVLNSNNYNFVAEGNALVEFIGVAAPTIPNLAVATANRAQGTRP